MKAVWVDKDGNFSVFLLLGFHYDFYGPYVFFTSWVTSSIETL